MSLTDTVTPSAASERLIGRVKWFNNKAGYGFITVTDGSRSGSDVFVHHSAIGVTNQQYKYLIQGEYVDFNLVQTQGGVHEFQASNVCGIKGGKLMCETRHEFKIARSSYKTTSKDTGLPVEVSSTKPRQRHNTTPRARNEVTQNELPKDDEKKEWTLIKNRQSEKPSGRGRGRPPRSKE